MGTLYIVSTPIGNLEDITIRALKTLFNVDAVACEDTRVTGQLLNLLQNKYKDIVPASGKPILISYRDTNEETIAPELINRLEHGESIALVSDAGTPLISDPGFRIVQYAKKRNIPVVVIPGVSAFLAALSGSGLAVNAFTFLGYLPEKQGKRIAELKAMKKQDVSPTYICYAAPHKLLKTLADMEEIFGNIPIVLARELTKLHEEYWKGTIKEARIHFSAPKGEFVLLFELPPR